MAKSPKLEGKLRKLKAKRKVQETRKAVSAIKRKIDSAYKKEDSAMKRYQKAEKSPHKSPKQKKARSARMVKARKEAKTFEREIKREKTAHHHAAERYAKAVRRLEEVTECKVHAGRGCGDFDRHSTRLRKVKTEGYGRTGVSKHSPTKKHIGKNYRGRHALKSRVKHGKEQYRENPHLMANVAAGKDLREKYGKNIHQFPGKVWKGTSSGYTKKQHAEYRKYFNDQRKVHLQDFNDQFS